MAIWVIKDNQREGPYEEDDVRELIYEGTYGDADLAIRDGQYHWSTLGEVLGKTRPAYETALMDQQQTPADDELLAGEQPHHFSESVAQNGELPATTVTAPAAATMQPLEMPQTEPEAAPTFVQVPQAIEQLPPRSAPVAPAQPATPVAIVDFQMPFTSMVIFMLKWALATVPALMILGTIIGLFWVGIAMLLAAVAGH
jgi:hypothetical protein